MSAEGMEFLREFNDLFNCGFRFDEPGGVGLLFDDDENDKTYAVPEWETVEDFKEVVTESKTSGVNLFPERYRDHVIEYEEDSVY